MKLPYLVIISVFMLIKSNMRCIETTAEKLAQRRKAIKSNMRCIETLETTERLTIRQKIKSNMRCIETNISHRYSINPL